MSKEELHLADNVASIIVNAFHGETGENDVLILFQTIARQVFHQHQCRVVSFKEDALQPDEVHADDNQFEGDSDEVLLQVSGAQLHRMINVRKDKLKKVNKDIPTAVIQSEIKFLQHLTMNSIQKESLPTALKSTELGGRTFLLMDLIPFVRQIVSTVRQEVNEDSFNRYGERLFKLIQHDLKHLYNIIIVCCYHAIQQVTQLKLQCDKTLLELFYTCWRKAVGNDVEEHDGDIVKYCLDEYVGKIVNACKKDWEALRERLAGNVITLNLRDKLKANIAQQHY